MKAAFLLLILCVLVIWSILCAKYKNDVGKWLKISIRKIFQEDYFSDRKRI